MRIGLLTAPSGGPHLPAIVEAFEARYSQCRVEVVEVDVHDPFDDLHRGQLDVMATWLPHGQPELVVGPVLTAQPRVLAVGRGHPLADRESVSVEDIANYRFPYVRGLTERLIPPANAEWAADFASTAGSAPPPVRPKPDNHRAADLVVRGAVVHPTVPSVAAYWGHPSGSRRRAGCVCFPRYLGPHVEDFCRRLVEREGVLFLPASIFASELAELPADRLRVGVGRRDPQPALDALERFLPADDDGAL